MVVVSRLGHSVDGVIDWCVVWMKYWKYQSNQTRTFSMLRLKSFGPGC